MQPRRFGPWKAAAYVALRQSRVVEDRIHDIRE
jgi:hypothetical protein